MKKLRRTGITLMAILREIFDESPYRRFLQRTGRPSSSASYREFLRQKFGERPASRCC
ncbi:MAG TPA: hypothetical protein VJQ50_07015 [Terriglobales bacterium]|nr:hypothetical protein [Terriglobales bacterium]